MRRLISLATVWGLLVVPASADEPTSGLEVGKSAPGFEMQVATGDEAGKAVDYLKKWDKKPVLVIFVGEMTRPAFGLLQQLDKYGRLRQPEGLEVLIVRVAADAEAANRQAQVLFEKYEVKSPSGTVAEGKAGPKDYGLNEDAQVTVLLLDKQHKVAHNLARRAADRTDFAAVREGIDKLLGPSPVAFP